VFLHDVLFLDHPRWFTRLENIYFRLMAISSHRAKWVFTSSKSEAKRIERHLRIRDVTAVGLALMPNLAAARPQSVSGLDVAQFVLTVGRLNVRKNLGTAISAATMSGRISEDFPLVVVGESSGKAEAYSSEVLAAIARNEVLFLGTVTDAELRWLYESAALFLFLSLDEGFGLPCLEAREFGTLSLVSDIDVFREILGDAGHYVDPSNESLVAAEISALLDTQLDETGPGQHGDVYSWDASASDIRSKIAGTAMYSRRK